MGVAWAWRGRGVTVPRRVREPSGEDAGAPLKRPELDPHLLPPMVRGDTGWGGTHGWRGDTPMGEGGRHGLGDGDRRSHGGDTDTGGHMGTGGSGGAGGGGGDSWGVGGGRVPCPHVPPCVPMSPRVAPPPCPPQGLLLSGEDPPRTEPLPRAEAAPQ